jgi:hypothetical protein
VHREKRQEDNMARYGVVTKLSPEEVINRAMRFFGDGGLGLEAKEEGACCASFTGGGGHVRVTVASKQDLTDVDLETREWDYDVKRFMRRIGK